MSAPALLHAEEALRFAEAIADRSTRLLVQQGLVDVLGTRSLRDDDPPFALDLLVHARCLGAVYADRARVAALASGMAPAAVDEIELSARVAAAEAAGAICRGAEALAHVATLPAGPARELLHEGLGASAALLAAGDAREAPVDFALQARLLAESFRKTTLIRTLAEGREPGDWI